MVFGGFPAVTPHLGPDFADMPLASEGAKIRALLNDPKISEADRERLSYLERLHSLEYFGY